MSFLDPLHDEVFLRTQNLAVVLVKPSRLFEARPRGGKIVPTLLHPSNGQKLGDVMLPRKEFGDEVRKLMEGEYQCENRRGTTHPFQDCRSLFVQHRRSLDFSELPP